MATVVTGLDTKGNDLASIASHLKSTCGSGGTVKGDAIEVQGDHKERIAAELLKIGYKLRP